MVAEGIGGQASGAVARQKRASLLVSKRDALSSPVCIYVCIYVYSSLSTQDT